MARRSAAAVNYEMDSVSSVAVRDDNPDFTAPKLRKTDSWARAFKVLSWPTADPTAASNVGDTKLLEVAKLELRQCMTGSKTGDACSNASWMWLVQYLEGRIGGIYETAVSPVLLQADNKPTTWDSPQVRANVYKIMVNIVLLLQENDVTLKTMAMCLRKENLIKDMEDPLVVQMLFRFLGWLTALFDPAVEISGTGFDLVQDQRQYRRRRIMRVAVVHTSSIDLQPARQPLHRMMNRFGTLIPKIAPGTVRSDALGGLEAGAEYITAPYVSFHGLQQVLKVQIDWVNTVNKHLDFDSNGNILHVFRFPSLLRVMYRENRGTILSRLFDDNRNESDGFSNSSPNTTSFHSTTTAGANRSSSTQPDFDDFIAEMLLSYTLIFAQTRRSRNAISAELAAEKPKWEPEGLYDPLLEALCTQRPGSADMVALYSALEAHPFSDYVYASEFPFLAPRLLELQRYSMGSNPHSWRRLWYDRRNMSTWFALWIVAIIGGGTLFIQVLQLVFQIYQPFN